MPDYAVIDAETTELEAGEIPRTKFWGYADRTRYEQFKTTKGLLKFLKEQSAKVLIHHSNFDIIQCLIDGAEVDILKSHNGKLIKCRIDKHMTVNSFSVFPVALKKIFQAFGFKKTSLKDLQKRNYEDCVNGLKCFLELDSMFQNLCGISPLLKGTIAATGFGAAEKFAGKMPKDLRFVSAYRGGRVEVYDTRKTTASKFDIQSSYPQSFIESFSGNAELWRVKLDCKDWHAPLFDAARDDILLFPNGQFYSWVFRDTWEKYIEPSVTRTTIKILSRHPINLSWLAELKPLIKQIYERKNQSTGGIKLCCKFLLNSLYGRIGLRGESERVRILPYRPDGDGVICYALGRKRWIVFDTVERESRSNYPLAAFITDNARGRLFQSFKNNHALYGDTDSVFASCNRSKFSGTLGEGLGEWAYCGREKFKAINVKDYEWGDDKVLKGGKDFKAWTLKRFAKGETVESVHRTRQTALRKRIVLPNGETMPHTVNY